MDVQRTYICMCIYIRQRTTCKELTDQIISTSKLSVNIDKVSEQKLMLSELKNSINHKNGVCGGKLSVLFSNIRKCRANHAEQTESRLISLENYTM